MTSQVADAPPVRSIEPGPPGHGWVRRLLPFLAAHRGKVALAFGMAVAGQGIASLAPAVERLIVDDVIVGSSRPLAPWLTVLTLIGLVSFGAAYVRRFVGGRVALDVQYDLRNAIYERLQRLDFARHDQLQTGQLVSRASSDVALLQGLLSFLPIAIGNVVGLVVAFVVMLILSPLLTVVALAALPVLIVVSLRLRTSIFPATWDAQQRAGEVAGVVEEATSGVRVVKGFGQERRELARLVDVGADLYRSRVRMVRLQARFTPALQAVPSLSQAAVLAFGGWQAIEGRITLGTFLAFSTYMVQLVAPVRMLAAVVAYGQQARAGAERIFDLLDATPLVADRPGVTALDVVQGAVSFDDVTFGYTRSSPVLRGLTLDVRPGEVVALVGASGSGKSTVALLLPRFYDVLGGAVRVDGVDVRDATLESLRRQIGVVFEDSFLFSDTVRANIAYGRPDATDDQVRAAARAAGAAGFVEALEDGYDTVVGERGLSLSGGQRQRVALARALLTDPRVLVLDDATSSVDATTEEEIHATLRRLMRGRTTLVVAHRRSTLRLADRVVVVDGGRVLDDGTHAELIERCPLYRQLLSGPGDALDADALDADALDADGDDRATDARDGPRGDGAEPPHGSNGAAAATSASGSITLVAEASNPAAGVAAGAEVAVGASRTSAGGAAPGTEPARSRSLRATAAGAGSGGEGGAWGPPPLQATPELLAAVAKLPPADDDPGIDVERETRPEDGFTLRRFARTYRRSLGIGLGLVVLDTLLILTGPVLVRYGLDNGVSRAATGPLAVASVAFTLTSLADWLVTWAYTRHTGRTAERMLYALRIRIFAHLQRLGVDFYDRELAGRIMTRMTTDVEALSQLLQTGLINAVVSLLSFVGVLGVLAVLSPPLMMATAAVVPPLVAATVWFRRRSARAYERARDRVAAVNADLQESLSGVRVTQAYTREGRNLRSFRRLAAQHLDARLDAQRLVALYFPFVLLLASLAHVIVLGVGARLVDGRTVTAGVVIAFLLYLDQFFSPLQQLSQLFDTWQQARAGVVKIDELMAVPTSTPVAARPVVPGRLQGRITFDAVHFSYAGSAIEALAGIDLEVNPGETVALVGETGAGKSTVVKLVARFYDPTSGRVLVDGTPLRDFEPVAYRRQLGYVPQEPFLFTGTVADNIAYGRPAASRDDIEAAARAVGAHEFIGELPHGYDHPVTERGRSLSAGQRQLICLARAHLVDPVILLLDEATSNLDLRTEARVAQAMGAVARGRTTLVVAHRLQTAAAATRIVVIHAGRVVEEGRHHELVGAGGRYARMWASFGPGEGPSRRAVPAPAAAPRPGPVGSALLDRAGGGPVP